MADPVAEIRFASTNRRKAAPLSGAVRIVGTSAPVFMVSLVLGAARTLMRCMPPEAPLHDRSDAYPPVFGGQRAQGAQLAGGAPSTTRSRRAAGSTGCRRRAEHPWCIARSACDASCRTPLTLPSHPGVGYVPLRLSEQNGGTRSTRAYLLITPADSTHRRTPPARTSPGKPKIPPDQKIGRDLVNCPRANSRTAAAWT